MWRIGGLLQGIKSAANINFLLMASFLHYKGMLELFLNVIVMQRSSKSVVQSLAHNTVGTARLPKGLTLGLVPHALMVP